MTLVERLEDVPTAALLQIANALQSKKLDETNKAYLLGVLGVIKNRREWK